MSVYASAYVWEHSSQTGAALLLLLAIADIADKTGRCFPSVPTLARYTRMSERQTQRLVGKLVKSQEVKILRNAGPKGTHVYQIVMNATLPLFAEGGVKLSPDKLTPDTTGIEGVTNDPQRGDTATSHEPLTVKENRTTGRASPSPVSLAFKEYAEGIKRHHGGDYPPNAKANGQLANVVARVGAEHVVDVVRAYLASQNPFYAKVKHKLDYLVRDCEQIYLELQAVKPGARPPTHARVALLKADGTLIRELEQYPAGNMEDIAKRAAKEYAAAIARLEPRYVSVVQGTDRRRFSPSELVGVSS